ncbi:ATP-dependent DNA helicase RecG [Curvivirga aplysinae]|uniref:ATP-dependent DNA helicase RecG n=1 Tax=Curvivirga aplysinae TaxID=2529852 RepID=UPI0012BBED54|nr:ATP-dependent DNA helicase RecG [Curvivirga aplysinae]MTI10849.1 ATP-dependent DNA helicase RecG [Curvivirga aplysinae]
MRPEKLFPLFSPLETLTGIGPRIAVLLGKLTGPHVIDLLWHLPREIIDRSYMPTIEKCISGKVATIKVQVMGHEPSSDRRRPYKVICKDDTGFLTLVFFKGNKKYLEAQLPIGETRLISGKTERYQNRLQMSHPDFIVPEDQADSLPKIEPIYPLAAGLTAKTVFKATHQALEKTPDFEEWQDEAYLKKQGWPSWKEALLQVHNPSSSVSLLPEHPIRQRLAFDELLANQLALSIMRAKAKRQKGFPFKGDGNLRKSIINALPFQLTKSQETTLNEIYEDMATNSRMLRLVQGDVGSGKTVVALLAMANIVECGKQAALMAPTDILARQHFESLEPLATEAGIKLAVLTGRDKGKPRKALLERLKAGEIDILIGTHALFQDDVIYKDLALAVIDEQHRFGVHQRLGLASKGAAVDMLVMTATPIPRTLMMSAYGDLDVSRLIDKPPGRQPIQTIVVSQDRLSEVINSLGRKIKDGAKIYWVCPLVEESELLDLPAAEDRYRDLSAHFGEERVAIVHGQMKAKDKDAAMLSFVEGDCNILVATTVIEVGVNVPEATIMVIDHAQHFGLAQLHQLRGRIGRGDKASTCILLRSNKLTETAKQRLSVMSETEDGFIIAEKDLELRGAGEVLGTRQSGLPEMKLADIAEHADLMQAAYDDARIVISRDPELTSDRGKKLRNLLYLFERDQAVGNLRSG